MLFQEQEHIYILLPWDYPLAFRLHIMSLSLGGSGSLQYLSPSSIKNHSLLSLLSSVPWGAAVVAMREALYKISQL